MSTKIEYTVRFKQEELDAFGRAIATGEPDAKQAQIAFEFPFLGSVVGGVAHRTRNSDDQLESFVLKFPHKFENPAPVQSYYLGVLLNSEGKWTIPNLRGVFWEEEHMEPASYEQLVRLGIFTGA